MSDPSAIRTSLRCVRCTPINMVHGLTNQFLYSAYKISVTFADDLGNEKSGAGTCFFVKNQHNVLCLVTNRHILDIAYKDSSGALSRYTLQEVRVSGKVGRSGDHFPLDDVSICLAPIVKFSEDYQNDIACITNIFILSEHKVPVSFDYHIPYGFLATSADFQNKLEICDFLAFPGFPEWYDKKENRPILRTGTISSDPRFDYSYGNSVGGACVAYEAFSYSGSSGSPVFSIQKGPRPGPGMLFPDFRDVLLIGINAGHLKFSPPNELHPGISYLYKSTAVLEIIDN